MATPPDNGISTEMALMLGEIRANVARIPQLFDKLEILEGRVNVVEAETRSINALTTDVTALDGRTTALESWRTTTEGKAAGAGWAAKAIWGIITVVVAVATYAWGEFKDDRQRVPVVPAAEVIWLAQR